MAGTDDVSQLAALALDAFGDTWHLDNVNYEWVNHNWWQTKGTPKGRNG